MIRCKRDEEEEELHNARFIGNSILDKIKYVEVIRQPVCIFLISWIEAINLPPKNTPSFFELGFISWFYNSRSFLIWGQVTNIC